MWGVAAKFANLMAGKLIDLIGSRKIIIACLVALVADFALSPRAPGEPVRQRSPRLEVGREVQCRLDRPACRGAARPCPRKEGVGLGINGVAAGVVCQLLGKAGVLDRLVRPLRLEVHQRVAQLDEHVEVLSGSAPPFSNGVPLRAAARTRTSPERIPTSASRHTGARQAVRGNRSSSHWAMR